jgi:HAD superfamily hydrolase (TIGR01509 family)
VTVEALVFDLDGVLADTELVHLEAARALVAPAELPMSDYERFIGTSGFPEWISETYGLTREQIRVDYDRLFHEHLGRGDLEPMAGAHALFDAAEARGLPVAVASQSSLRWVEATLEAIGLRERVPLIVTSGDVARGKPAPDIYLHVAREIGVAPASAIAIEDSAHGVAAAAAAGMIVVQSTQASITPPPQPGAHALIDSLEAFDLGWFDAPPGGAQDRVEARAER